MKPVAEMSEQEKAQIRAWIQNWREVGKVLERERLDSLQHVNTAEAIEALDTAYKSARLHCAPRRTSGLVEQQRWFMRARQ